MAEAWAKANEIKDYREEFSFPDGDFVVNFSYWWKMLGIGMKDETKIPEVNEEVYNKILEFAEKRDLKVVKVEPSSKRVTCHYIELKRKLKNWKERLKFLILPSTQIFVGHHFYTAKRPELFKEFGSYVYGLKTEKEKVII